GVVVNALIGAGAYALLSLGDRLPAAGLVPLALVAGVGAFGWVGLYFALVAEIGGARYAGLLTGVAVAFAWSGVLVGPPVFGVLAWALEHVAGVVGARRAGGSRAAVVGATLGLLVGVMVAPIGLLLGPLIGAIAGELLAGRAPGPSVRTGVGAALGVLTGVVAHFAP